MSISISPTNLNNFSYLLYLLATTTAHQIEVTPATIFQHNLPNILFTNKFIYTLQPIYIQYVW